MRRGRLREIDTSELTRCSENQLPKWRIGKKENSLHFQRRGAPLCRRYVRAWARARAESRLCRRPGDEPGLVTVWGSLSGIPADLAWMEGGEINLQPSIPRWRQPTCGCRSLLVLLALLCQSSPPRDSKFRLEENWVINLPEPLWWSLDPAHSPFQCLLLLGISSLAASSRPTSFDFLSFFFFFHNRIFMNTLQQLEIERSVRPQLMF